MWRKLEKPFASVRAYVRRHWQRALQIRGRLVISEEVIHLALAGVVGLIGGAINLFFYGAVRVVQIVFLGYSGRNIVEAAQALPLAWRVAIPAFGGLIAGLILYWGGRLARRQGPSNLLEVVVAGDGRLPFRTGAVRFLSSLVSIGTGSSIGREGAVANLSATVASKWGQLISAQPYRLRLLVACGAAAGMAAAYNAPIAGAVFAAQIVLGNFSMSLFAPLLFSSVVASMMSRSFFGVRPWYEVPSMDFTSITQLPWFILLGILAGVLGAVFLKALRRSGNVFQEVPTLYLRLALGGLLVGVIGIAYPGVWGNGYSVTNQMLSDPQMLGPDPFGIPIPLGLLSAKFVATVITVGAGAVGGVFTPTLFLGAGLGSVLWLLLHRFGLGPADMPEGVFALVGMGSILAATTRSPLLAIIMMLEISLNYSLMPPLMLGCAVATLVCRRLHPNSIYTEPLRLRSLEVETHRLGVATEQTVGDFMRAPVPPVPENATLPEMAERFLSSSNNFLPVVDRQQRLLGMVALHDLKPYLTSGKELLPVIALDVMRPAPACLTPNQKLMEAFPVLLGSEQQNVPVVNTLIERKLVGAVPRGEALAVLSEAIAASTVTTASTEIKLAPEQRS